MLQDLSSRRNKREKLTVTSNRFSALSRQIHLIHCLRTAFQSQNQQQPTNAFFITTNQLARQQSQLILRIPGPGQSESSEGNSARFAGSPSLSHPTTLTPLTSLDDDLSNESPGVVVHHRKLCTNIGKLPKISQNSTRFETGSCRQRSNSFPTRVVPTRPSPCGSSFETLSNAQHVREYTTKRSSSAHSLDLITGSPEVKPSTENLNLQRKPSLTERLEEVRQSGSFQELVQLHQAEILPSKEYISASIQLKVLQCALQLASKSPEIKDEDVEQVLGIYSDILSSGVPPSTEDYTGLLMFLVHASESAISQAEYIHSRGLCLNEPVICSLHENSRSYSRLALKLLAASNTVNTRRYPRSLLSKLLETCVNINSGNMMSVVLEASGHWAHDHAPATLLLQIKGYGCQKNSKNVLQTYERFKKNVSSDEITWWLDAHCALIEAHFGAGQARMALSLYDFLLQHYTDENIAPFTGRHRKDFQKLSESVISGFANSGDISTAWRWVERMETDHFLPAPGAKQVIDLFIKTCESRLIDLASEKFHYLASRQDIADDPGMNDARSNFVDMCLALNSRPLLFKALRECHLREGVLQYSTTVRACLSIVRTCRDTRTAVGFLVSQTDRYSSLVSSLDLKEKFRPDFGSVLKEFVDACDTLDLTEALILGESTLFSPNYISAISSDVYQKLLEIFSSAFSENLRLSTQLRLLIVCNKWIKGSNVTGNVHKHAIPISKNTTLPKLYVRIVRSIAPYLKSNPLLNDTRECLSILHQDEIAGLLRNQEALTDSIWGLEYDRRATDLIISFSKSAGSQQKAFEIFDNCVLQRKPVGLSAFTSLITGASLAKSRADVNRVLEGAKILVPEPDIHPIAREYWISIHRIVLEHATELDYQAACRSSDALAELESYPTVSGCAELIRNCPLSAECDTKMDPLKIFHRWLDTGQAPDQDLYSVLLSKLEKAGRIKDVFEVYDDMRHRQMTKKNSIYGPIISAACKQGDGVRARALFDEWVSSRDHTPQISIYNTLIHFYIYSLKDRTSALEFFDQLKSNERIEPSSYTYLLMMEAFATLEPIDVDGADEILMTMTQKGARITTRHYAALIQARGMGMKNPQEAMNFYTSLTERKRIRPDKTIFRVLLECFVANDRIQDTSAILEEMLRYKIRLSNVMANLLIRAWAPVSLARSVTIFEDMYHSGRAQPAMFETLVQALVSNNEYNCAKDILRLMVLKNMPEESLLRVREIVQN